MYKHACLQIKGLCTKSYCHTPRPNGCFVLSVISSQKHTLTRTDKEFHLLLSCRTTKPKFMCAFYLTRNLPHSTQAALWGVVSKQRARLLASIKYTVLACVHAYTYLITHTHVISHYTHTRRHTLPDASSLVHLIAGDGSH